MGMTDDVTEIRMRSVQKGTIMVQEEFSVTPEIERNTVPLTIHTYIHTHFLQILFIFAVISNQYAMFVAKTIPAEHKDLIHDVAYDFHGRRMATCSSDQCVKVNNHSIRTSRLSFFSQANSHWLKLASSKLDKDLAPLKLYVVTSKKL